MKILKFLVLTIIITILISILPLCIFNKTNDMSQFYAPVQGSSLTGILGYQNKIAMDPIASQELKENSEKMLLLSNSMIEYKNNSYNTLIAYLIIIQDVSLAFLSIILLKKTDYKLLSKSIIASCIISFLILICMFFIIKLNIVI